MTILYLERLLKNPLAYFRCSKRDSKGWSGREWSRWALSGFFPCCWMQIWGKVEDALILRCSQLDLWHLWHWGSAHIHWFCSSEIFLPDFPPSQLSGLLQALEKGQTQESTQIKHILSGGNFSWVSQISVWVLNLCLLSSSFVCTSYNWSDFSKIWNIQIYSLFPYLFLKIV